MLMHRICHVSMIATRLDLAYTISFLSRFTSNLKKPYWARLKWLLRYVVGTLSTRLVFERRPEQFTLKGDVEFDFAGYKYQRNSTTAYFFTPSNNYIT